mmetsp:Transcript_7216/g.8152  ORF Transcript_7216/g.8152 Transcript_7216/m.8152 type:complete len:1138 (-) Transcript_7216:198-3611(-)|eukprot:CAMPEP_0205826790 /NCGR_PEP_ID=MMETSP0206-20130828/29850_1 /ASSEMBLY_ACC=CAM_ASM_000279 /TAXON_ID=36767 /ORGANISM="Euplotes focardii, Strain TN1" /LENGTH=1137 /DNA_ID=CAMNT_0053127039 /DNA_START=21 /DNA_END=3434 /DNA_ORIENTATION=+
MKLLCLALFGVVGVQGSSFPDATGCDAHDATLGDTVMDWTTPMVRTDMYTIRSGDRACEHDRTHYVPDEYVTIYLRTTKARMQFRGLLLYADDSAGNKVGTWESFDETYFWMPPNCNGAVMHLSAAPKHYLHTFRFRAPAAGTGPITFQGLIKRGEANLGEFYWPNLNGELVLQEAVAPPRSWYVGSNGATCEETCAPHGGCDEALMNSLSSHSTETFYRQLSRHATCTLPLLDASCDPTPMMGPDGWCSVPGEQCELDMVVKCQVRAEATHKPLCACGTQGAPRAADIVPVCIGAASGKGPSSSVWVMLLASVAVFGKSTSRTVVLVGALLGMLLLPSADAHNWVRSPSRSRGQASTLKPCRNRINVSNPHFQIGGDQTFEIEWATGHNHYFYFTVVHEDDAPKLANLTAKIINKYLDDAQATPPPPDLRTYHFEATTSGPDAGKGDFWAKQHINRGAEQEDHYVKELTQQDEDWIPRHERYGTSDVTHWKYKRDFVKEDLRFSYSNPEFPYIVAVHRFKMVGMSRPGDVDVARFTIDGDVGGYKRGPGKYIVNYLWRGYYDCVDVDVWPTPVDSIYGRAVTPEDDVWLKLDHCQLMDVGMSIRTPCREVLTTPAKCLAECQASITCGGVNVVPRWNPKEVSPDLVGESNLPFSHRLCNEQQFMGADDDTMVCFGVTPRQPNNTFSEWTVSMDPQDPVFYSTCYLKQASYLFEQAFEEVDTDSTKQNPIPWHYGGKCISCEDRAKAAFSSDVPRWKIQDHCEPCTEESLVPPETVPVLAHLVAKDRMCDGATGRDGRANFVHRSSSPCSTSRCTKELELINWEHVTMEECVHMVKHDEDCSDTFMFDVVNEEGCICYRNNDCCGECTPSDYKSRAWGMNIFSVGKMEGEVADPTCANGVRSSDNSLCCSASCVNSLGNPQCNHEAEIKINFQPGNMVDIDGWLSDGGSAFADNVDGSGLDYGWRNCRVEVVRDLDPDWVGNVAGTGVNLPRCGADWEIALPNGFYAVATLHFFTRNMDNSECTIEGLALAGEERADGNTGTWAYGVVEVKDGFLTFAGRPNGCNWINAIKIWAGKDLVDLPQSMPGTCEYNEGLEERPCNMFSAPCSDVGGSAPVTTTAPTPPTTSSPSAAPSPGA